MKNLYLLAAAFIFQMAAAQDTEAIAEAEMKSAASLMNVAVNPNTANYDITYHKLEFTVNPANYFISGKITTTFTALASMTTLTFDMASELTVSSVKKNGVNLTFSESGNDELVIALGSTLAAGASATVEVTYSGPPASGEQAFTTTSHDGVPVLWTLSEPFGARDWWPCKQDLNDKVDSVDVYITAPSQYVSVANGLEQSQAVSGSNKTTHFHHGYPIPAYLIAIAVTNYDVFTQQGGLGTDASPFFPIVNYMYPETASANIASLAPTPAIINLFESLFGAYPFREEKYGHAQFSWGGGMEHTTVSFMTANSSGAYSRSLIAHEMGHQWFGDKVTCGSWRDIWLNEGFAEYASGLVVENLDGNDNFIAWKNSKINNITSQPGGALYLTESEATNVSRIFSSRLTYNKGAMVANMLRFKLGDAVFFQGIQNYLNDSDLAYAYAVTPNLKSHLEAVSGVDLDEFFNDWVYKQGYPIYDITAQNIGPGQVRFVINQSSSHISVPFFEMPVPVRVFGPAGQQLDIVLNNTADGEQFIVNVPFAVSSFVFDPEKELISKNSTVTLGLASNDVFEGVQLFPNPAGSTISVSLPVGVSATKIVISNILGQVISESTQHENIDISSLQTGVHFLTVFTDQGNRTMRFIRK